MPKVGRMLAYWDETRIIENEVQNRLAEQEELIKTGFIDEEKTEQEIWDEVSVDNFLFYDEWLYFTEHLTEIIQKKNPDGFWKVVGRDLGWRKLDGYKYCYAKTGKELLREILPDTDCTFYVHNYGRGIAIKNFHHDAPTGEWYYILPCSQRTYEKYN